MAELLLVASLPRDELHERVRARMAEFGGALRVIAEDLLGADSTIDWVAVDAQGQLAVILLGQAGRELELIARGVAQRAWVGARIKDWLQLAPNLGIRPGGAGSGSSSSGQRSTAPPARRLQRWASRSNSGPTAGCAMGRASTSSWSGSSSAPRTCVRASLSFPRPGRSAFRSELSDAELGLTAPNGPSLRAPHRRTDDSRP